MGKRKSSGIQSHDKPKRNRKSTQQNNNGSSDEVSTISKNENENKRIEK